MSADPVGWIVVCDPGLVFTNTLCGRDEAVALAAELLSRKAPHLIRPHVCAVYPLEED